MNSITTYRRPVKNHRNTPRTPGRFGAGILRSVPTYRAPFTAEDAAWASQCFSHADVWREAMADAELEIRAAQAAWDDQFAAC